MAAHVFEKCISVLNCPDLEQIGLWGKLLTKDACSNKIQVDYSSSFLVQEVYCCPVVDAKCSS